MLKKLTALFLFSGESDALSYPLMTDDMESQGITEKDTDAGCPMKNGTVYHCTDVFMADPANVSDDLSCSFDDCMITVPIQ